MAPKPQSLTNADFFSFLFFHAIRGERKICEGTARRLQDFFVSSLLSSTHHPLLLWSFCSRCNMRAARIRIKKFFVQQCLPRRLLDHMLWVLHFKLHVGALSISSGTGNELKGNWKRESEIFYTSPLVNTLACTGGSVCHLLAVWL